MSAQVYFHAHPILPNVDSESFPENPVDGQLTLKQGQLWTYTLMAGITNWHPITQPKATYVHNQGVASLEWIITHGLNTTDLMATVYSNQSVDGTDRLVANVPIEFVSDNEVKLIFGDAVSGKAVVMSQGGVPSATQVLIPKLEEYFGGMKAQTSIQETSGNLRIKLTN